MSTATKTLQAALAPPTAHKERKLQDTLGTYRSALSEAFDAGCDTMSAVNDIVTPYDLPYQAKDALKSYVPKLRNTYNAREIDDEHPLRFVNRAAKFDHSADREAEFVWNVPQSGRGTNFWIPLRINPEQRELWSDLLDGEASAGELRLQRHRKRWMLHVTVEFDVPDTDTNGEQTAVGFDIGETALITGCALKRDLPTKPKMWSGKRAKALRKEMFTVLKRLQERDAEWRIDERFGHYQNALNDIVERASREAVEYATGFENPIIVMEDLTYIRERLDYGRYMNRRLHAWAFARLQGRVEDKATEAGIAVAYINPAYTSQECHECGHIGSRPHQGTFRCTNADCHVSEFQADISAAASIAKRLDPWGERCLWKTDINDSPRDRSGCDTATRHPEESAPT